MNTIDQIRRLRLLDPILDAAYRAYPDEDEAIRVALIAHIEYSKELIDKLVERVSQAPTVIRMADGGSSSLV